MAKEAARVGDPLSHGGSITKGSPKVFINGNPAARVNDQTSCGATITDGSPNVFIGDSGSPIGLNAESASLYDLTTFAGLYAALGVVPFAAGMVNGVAADCFDEAVCLSQARQSGTLADLPFFIEAEHGRRFSGKLDAQGRLPRIGTDNLGSYDIFWGDDALVKA